ncbi:MAG: phosphotriesterase family protein [Nesterenkonia sp.]
MKSQVDSLTGVVPADQLGTTLIHEHLIVSDPELDLNLPHPEWDEARVAEQLRAQLQQLAALGVDTIVDLTVAGLGRDVQRIAGMAHDAAVQIVVSTGYYTSNVLPHFFSLNGPDRLAPGPDPLTEMFLKDLTEAIAGTSVRAGMIKVASDSRGITDDVDRVFRAAATAQRETGVPITTHSDPASRSGLEQQHLLSRLGVPLDRVVIGHSGDSTDLDYLCHLAEAGSFVGFDRFGMTHMSNDADRLRTLCALLERGYQDHIVLSQDAAVFSRITPPTWRERHTPQWRMDHLHTTILPQLRDLGVDSRLEHQLLVNNPRRVLAGE